MLKRFAVLVLAMIGGGALGLTLAYLALSGLFVAWKPISKPPELASRILALSGPSVWVQTATGVIYLNISSYDCQRACWTVVAQVQSDPTQPVGIQEILPTPCAPPPPFFGALDQKGDCWRGVWQDYNTVYALRPDGSMWLWRFASGGEWGLVALVLGTCAGAAVLFVLALVVILFLSVLSRRDRRFDTSKGRARSQNPYNQ